MIKKKHFTLPRRICTGLKHNRYQRNVWGVGERHLPHLPSKGAYNAPQVNPTRSQEVTIKKLIDLCYGHLVSVCRHIIDI